MAVLNKPGYGADYKYITIDVPGADMTIPWCINNAGVIAGTYVEGDTTSGFVLEEKIYSPIICPDATITRVNGINISVELVGTCTVEQESQQYEHGYLYSNNQFFLIDYPNAHTTTPRDINDAGTIVGYYTDCQGDINGFKCTAEEYTQLNYPDSYQTQLTGVNNQNLITGYYIGPGTNGNCIGFLYDGVDFTVIECPNSEETLPMGINDSGAVVGNFKGSDGWQGFLYENGIFTIIEEYGESFEFKPVEAIRDINISGDIIGDYQSADMITHGLLRQPIQHDNGGSGCFISTLFNF